MPLRWGQAEAASLFVELFFGTLAQLLCYDSCQGYFPSIKKEVISVCFHDMDLLIRTSVLKVRSRRDIWINNKIHGLEFKTANTESVKLNKHST